MNETDERITNESVGERLARLRKSNGLSQAAIGLRFGLDRRTISSYENDTRELSTDVLEKYARLYHVSTDYILGVDNDRVIDADGLSDEEYRAIAFIVDSLSVKNAK